VDKELLISSTVDALLADHRGAFDITSASVGYLYDDRHRRRLPKIRSRRRAGVTLRNITAR